MRFFFLILLFTSLQVRAEVKRLSVLTYNVQNLFDVKHDDKKNDWTFLPAESVAKKVECQKIKNHYYRKQCFETDWSSSKLNSKIGQIKKVVDSLGKNLNLMALNEVENENVVSQLAKSLGFKKWIVTNSPDKRGVDVALMFNETNDFKLETSTEHILEGEYFEKKPTRNILEATFKINGKTTLVIFVNHWPSQANPTQARIIAAEKIVKRSQVILKKNPRANILAMGDFNTIDRDEPHPLNDVMSKNDFLTDLSKIATSQSFTGIGAEGTYFYYKKQVWNMLDRMMINKNLLDKKELEVDISTFKIHAPNFMKMKKKFGKKELQVPFPFNFSTNKKNELGYSDHFPVYVELFL